MMRRIIQIAVTSGGEDNGEVDVVYALANDGTVWALPLFLGSRGWRMLEALPQDDGNG